MVEHYTGIVLRSIRFNDAYNVVDIYTASRGRVSYMVPQSHSKKSRVKGVLFQPLSILDFESDYRPKSRLQYISEAKSRYLFRSLPFHPHKSAMALFLAEFLSRALREEQPDDSLFAYLEYSIHWFDTVEENFSNFHLVFLIHLSRFMGVYPNVTNYSQGDYFDMLNACFVSIPPFHGSFLSSEESKNIINLLRMNYDTMHRFSMSRHERGRCLKIINEYYKLHIPDFPDLKSLEVLQELFD